MRRSAVLASLASLTALASLTGTGSSHATVRERSYRSVVMDVARMVDSERAYRLVQARGLDLLNVMWEDTGRWEGSSVGPNISDVTIEVQTEDQKGRIQTALMPVIRYPNFTDKTGDVKTDLVKIPVGNQKKDGQLEVITLTELLRDPTPYMSLPQTGTIKHGTLLAKRDSHVLVSAQATFLPVPKEGTATFWPVIFNYQSTKRQPAVLTVLVTRQGTSMTIIDNARDSLGPSSWGQRLFFNSAGMRTPMTAERLSDVKQKGTTMNGESAASLGDDANLLMLIQVPLKIRQRRPPAPPSPSKAASSAGDYDMAAPMADAESGGGGGVERRGRVSDVETAVLGHGPELGPFVELDGKTIERDPRFPVRVTVQFYQATSNGVVNRADIARLHGQIKQVYKSADYVGSLVVPTSRDRERPTAWTGASKMPAGTTFASFPGLVERVGRYGEAGFVWVWKKGSWGRLF
jgi:hypothetical protein